MSETETIQEKLTEPLDIVIYFGNERVVIGKAVAVEGDNWVAEMLEDIDERALHILGHVQGEFKFSLPQRFRTAIREDIADMIADPVGDGSVPE